METNRPVGAIAYLPLSAESMEPKSRLVMEEGHVRRLRLCWYLPHNLVYSLQVYRSFVLSCSQCLSMALGKPPLQRCLESIHRHLSQNIALLPIMFTAPSRVAGRTLTTAHMEETRTGGTHIIPADGGYVIDLKNVRDMHASSRSARVVHSPKTVSDDVISHCPYRSSHPRLLRRRFCHTGARDSCVYVGGSL